MKQFSLKRLFAPFRKRTSLSPWLDFLTVPTAILLWMGVIFFFGLFYHFASDAYSFLYYVPEEQPVSSLSDAVYFSFIAAMTGGMGTILPFGLFKVLIIIEVIFSLLLVAIITSKLVSLKQDVILNELYEHYFNDKVGKLRSSLLLFRQSLDRLMNKVRREHQKTGHQ